MKRMSRKGLTKRLVRKMLREATEAIEELAWPVHRMVMRMRDRQDGRAGDEVFEQVMERLIRVDSRMMATASGLERALRGILPEARSAKVAARQLTLAW